MMKAFFFSTQKLLFSHITNKYFQTRFPNNAKFDENYQNIFPDHSVKVSFKNTKTFIQ